MIDLADLKSRLRSAQIASCTCQTKPPDPKHHKARCLYRVLCDAYDAVLELGRLRDAAPGN